MARVTTEDCIDKINNPFDLVVFSSFRAREIAASSEIAVARENDKDPIVALREIAEEKQSVGALKERLIESYQTQIEIDEPEADAVELMCDIEDEEPTTDDMNEEDVLRALMDAQRKEE